ncbi:9543_t:CDS:2 [Cetraspora pellucida]|uniref:9543_t:CDS:1 n=1 Tax=Cetraspora pellucida TaxID=1433469 RepID=A0A9N9ASE6_9GLOM|nr:9543_t:CDS:2 [Cetraspora pellucida]
MSPSQFKKHENISKSNWHNLIIDEEEISNTKLYLYSFYEYLFNGKIGAPVHENLRNGAKVLEFCSEGAVWSKEVAAEYPNSKFYAIDSIILSLTDEIKNLTLIGCDIFKKLPFLDNEFDYIFSTGEILFTEKNLFREVLSEIFRVLKPGGWLEVIYTYNSDVAYGPAYTRLNNAWNSWFKAQNIDDDILKNFENYLEETEKTESISHRIEEIQVGSDHASGEFLLEIVLLFYRNVRNEFAHLMNISLEEFDDLVNQFESELNGKDSKVILSHKQVLAKKKCTHSDISSTVSSTK